MSGDFKMELYRKALHLSSFWMVFLLYFYPPFINAVLFGSLFIIGLVFEYGYHHKIGLFYKLYRIFFEKILRPQEKAEQTFILSGGVWMLLAAFISSIVFTPENAVIAFSIMLLSDTVAGLVGKRFGKTKIYVNKSLQGSCAALAISLLTVCLYGVCFSFSPKDYLVGILAAFAGVLAELYTSKLKIDDNLSIALIVGAVLSIRGFI